MTFIYLVRHAEVTPHAEVHAAAWSLSPAGREAAEALAGSPIWRTLAGIASSAEAKALATAQPIADAAKLPLRIEPDLQEVDRGATPLVAPAAYVALVASHFAAPDQRANGWECACAAAARITSCIERLAAETPGSLCIVSHGLVLAHLIAKLRGRAAPDLDEWRAMTQPALAVIDARTFAVLEPV